MIQTTKLQRYFPFTCGDSLFRDHFTGELMNDQYNYHGLVSINGIDLFYTWRDTNGERNWQYKG